MFHYVHEYNVNLHHRENLKPYTFVEKSTDIIFPAVAEMSPITEWNSAIHGNIQTLATGSSSRFTFDTSYMEIFRPKIAE
jgi:hypothetical protein